MYVYVCICVYMYVRMHLYEWMYTSCVCMTCGFWLLESHWKDIMCAHICMYTFIWMDVYIVCMNHVRMDSDFLNRIEKCIYVCVNMFIANIYVVCIRTHVSVHTHTRTNAHTHTHTHTRKPTSHATNGAKSSGWLLIYLPANFLSLTYPSSLPHSSARSLPSLSAHWLESCTSSCMYLYMCVCM